MKILAVCTLAIVCLVQFSQAGNIRNSDLAKRAELQRALLNVGPRKTVPEIIEKHGYPSEKHSVQTADGYILEVHRVPHARGRPNSVTKGVAFLQHGLFSSSADFLVSGDKSLGFYLSELGYDVWLGNARGNTNSKNHISLSPAQSAFWQFSWHEMGNFDVTAMIDYILAVTGEEKLHIIGHSQGCTDFVVMATERPEYNAKIKSFQALAPPIFMKHQPNILLQIIARFETQLGWVASAIGLNEFLPSMGIIEEIGKVFCQDDDWTQGILCNNIYFMIAGYNPDQLNATLIPEILENVPAGASTKQLLHFAQLITSANFQKYNYGWFKNNKIYGQAFPPKYDLKKLTAPTYLYYSDKDNMVSARDVEYLADQLPNIKGLLKIADKRWGHIDYLMGIDAIEYVYSHVAKNMEKS
ncbi:lipase 3-like [Ctenocephalides felis]|uniref:lipase 3-like n=1 Tax=Ctenocephalides felis TaxID=7515 RepID=UPI000E6E3D58|nr:lipase 3-like [Ctenocephalides felis]XP_026482360.1 lipase 3-like [Ctenocephalides felis]